VTFFFCSFLSDPLAQQALRQLEERESKKARIDAARSTEKVAEGEGEEGEELGEDEWEVVKITVSAGTQTREGIGM
jgi:hypothetical protein